MIELPDDELDKLFRKSSEELDPTYEPDDWNDLRKRLDKQDGKTPAGWWRKWWPLGVLALLIPAGITLYSLEGEKGGKDDGGRNVALKGEEGRKENGGSEEGVKERERTEDGGSERGVVEEGGVSESGVVKESGRSSEVARKPAEEATKKQAIADNGNPSVDNERKLVAGANEIARNRKADIKNELKTSEKEAGKSSSKSELNAAASYGRKPLPRSESKAGGVFLEPNRSKVEGGAGALSIQNNANAEGRETSLPYATGRQDGNAASKELTEAGPVSTGESLTKVDEPHRALISASALDSKALKWNVLQLPGISQPVYELAEPPAPRKQSSMSADDRPLMAVRFGYSPDLSTVGLKDFSKPGTSVSLLVEYSVFPRLYLQSGAVWSRKDYYAPAEAYQLPKIAHVYLPKMTGIDGVCKILEVPVNLRYDIALKQRSRWFAGVGFSSYHMNSEKYKYYYVNPNDPNAVKYPGWNGKTGWYWLSHANVSAGYEYRISRKLSLLAEPSIRMPLKRVGYGKVNLITTGLWLSVRYTPVFK